MLRERRIWMAAAILWPLSCQLVMGQGKDGTDVIEVAAVLHDARAFAGAHDVEVEDGFAYVAGKGNSIAIVDVSQPANPKLIWSVTDKKYEDAETVLPLGKILLVGTRDLCLFDVANPKQPVLISKLSDRPRIDRINGLAKGGSTFFAANKQGYVTTFRIDDENTLKPSGVREARQKDGLVSPHDLALKDDLLVVVDGNSFGRQNKPGRVGIYRVSDSQNGHLPPDEWKLLARLEKQELAGCNRVAIRGKFAYTGSSVSPSAKPEGRTGSVAMIDLAEPTKPRLRGVVSFPDQRGPNGLTASGKVVFAAGGQTVQAVDVSNPDKPKVLAAVRLRDALNGGEDDAHDLVYEKGWLYVTGQTSHALVVVRVRDEEILRLATP